MHAVFDKKGNSISWIFRAAYLIALFYFGTICYLFYVQASQEASLTSSIRNVGVWFSKMDSNTRRYVGIAEGIENKRYQNFPSSVGGSSANVQMANFTAEKLRLYNAGKKASDKFEVFVRSWNKSIELLRANNVAHNDYEKIGVHFGNYRNFLSPIRVYDSNSFQELLAVSGHIKNENETTIAASRSAIWRMHKRMLEDRANMLSTLLESFLTFAFGGVIVLAVLIFLPIDYLLQRLLRKLKEDNVRIQEAINKAEIADRAKSEFLANMSHEIRTPMNGVMGMAELMVKTNLDHKQKTFVDIILRSGSALLTIINDILDFSKIDAGQMELDPKPFRLAEAIEDVAALVSTKVAEKDLELGVRIAPDLPEMVVGDVGRIRQIATNIIGNAVKFTETGHVYVNVSGVVENDLARLKFSVKDTGIGISPEKCDRIFEKFSQVDESATRRHEGTGLGLAISTSLVNLMEGSMGILSEVGMGSTFWFEIDLPVHETAAIQKTAPPDVTGARVLIVDSNEVNRSIMAENMAVWKFDSAATSTAAEALAVMRKMAENDIKLDCVVVDYHMPDMNGGDLVGEIRRDAKLRKIPIVILTSVDQTENGQTFSSLDIQGHLVKPVRSAQLLNTIVSALHDACSKSSETICGVAMARSIGNLDVGAPEISQSISDKAIGPSAAEEKREELAEKVANDIVVSDEPQLEHVNLEKTADELTNDTSRYAEMALKTEDVRSLSDAPPAIVAKQESPDEIDVLIAEDNEVNQIVFKQILENTGYSYVIANNGRKAVELYVKHKPKVICMDVSMPEMNGHEATKMIRDMEISLGIHTPIIGVTAHAVKGDKEECLAAGMDDYITKPVSPSMLEQRIHHWMNEEEKELLQA